jgi:hypothetical protein
MEGFPRDLTSREAELLYWLLPTEIEAYRPFKVFIDGSIVIGEGRWGEGDLMLAKIESEIDRTLGMSPVIAYGEALVAGSPLTISIHEPNIDDQLEVQFSGTFPLDENSSIENKWCYSYWKPGEACPATGTPLKEIELKNAAGQILFTFAVSKAKRSLWLHHHRSGFNQLIALTGFYDELLRTKNIRDPNLVTRPSTFFDKMEEFTDTEYRQALIDYDERTDKKIDLSEVIVREAKMKKKSLLNKLFSRS